MHHPPSVERRSAQLLLGITAVAVAGILAIVPYRLYQRDVRHATQVAQRVSGVVRVAMANALREGRPAAELVERLQSAGDMNITLSRIEPGEIHPTQNGRAQTRLHDVELTLTAPPILDAEGNAWLTTMEFDLSPMKRESVGLIIDLVLAVVLGSAVFATTIFLLIRRSLVTPLREVTERIEKMESPDEPLELPLFQTLEMHELAVALEKACRAHGLTT